MRIAVVDIDRLADFGLAIGIVASLAFWGAVAWWLLA